MDKEIENILWEYIKKNYISTYGNQKFDFDENFLNDGIIDSAGLVSFVDFIEKEFDLTIPDEELIPENFSSITTTAEYIRARM